MVQTSKPETIEYGLAANAIDFVLRAACRAAEPAPEGTSKDTRDVR